MSRLKQAAQLQAHFKNWNLIIRTRNKNYKIHSAKSNRREAKMHLTTSVSIAQSNSINYQTNKTTLIDISTKGKFALSLHF